MSIETDSQSSSQYLSSSQSSLNPSKKTLSEISKTYKHASQLYLTRRLAEAYEALQPVIATPLKTDDNSDYDVTPLAPIATATASQRIKIWSLYITLLNAIVDLGIDEGKRSFGHKDYKAILTKVQDGDIWEQVVQDGYRGREASVDAEVVYNLSTLLLGQAPTQTVNQSRLETYLSSSAQLDLDVSSHLNRSTSGRPRSQMNGTSTPKDLTSRLKILELFTLHVLPRNEEWDYARSFISNSDVLDDERREAFLQTLQELQDDKDVDGYEDQDVFEDTTEEIQKEDDERKRMEETGEAGSTLEGNNMQHKRTSSEVDYGIDKEHPNSTTTSNGHAPPTPVSTSSIKRPSPAPAQAAATPTNRDSHLSPPAQTPRNRPIRKSTQSKGNDVFTQARNLIFALQRLAQNMAGAITQNPTVLFRAMLFVLAFLMAFSRQAVRERARRIVSQGWTKVKGTVGMGVKVSYI